MESVEDLNITIRKGVPLPGKKKPKEPRKLSEIIAGMKRGESFLITPALRTRVLQTAHYLKRAGTISFGLMSRSIVEGGIPAICVWRVEE